MLFYHGFYHCRWMGSLTNPCFPACTALFLANHRRPPRAACLSTLDSLMCKRRGANEILNEMNVCITKSLSLSLALILCHQDTESILMKILLFPCWQEPMPSPLCRSSTLSEKHGVHSWTHGRANLLETWAFLFPFLVASLLLLLIVRVMDLSRSLTQF